MSATDVAVLIRSDDDVDGPTRAEVILDRALFHWAPFERRRQIQRYGLRPSMRPTLTEAEWRAPYVCFADTPSWAWGLSGQMPYAPTGEWDLWQTELSRLEEPVIVPSFDRQSGIHEIRTGHRLFKRDLWFVGSRLKP